MSAEIEKLVNQAAYLPSDEFAEFCRQLLKIRGQQRLLDEIPEEHLRAEELELSQKTLANDWQDVPEDWEANPCHSPEAK